MKLLWVNWVDREKQPVSSEDLHTFVLFIWIVQILPLRILSRRLIFPVSADKHKLNANWSLGDILIIQNVGTLIGCMPRWMWGFSSMTRLGRKRNSEARDWTIFEEIFCRAQAQLDVEVCNLQNWLQTMLCSFPLWSWTTWDWILLPMHWCLYSKRIYWVITIGMKAGDTWYCTIGSISKSFSHWWSMV